MIEIVTLGSSLWKLFKSFVDLVIQLYSDLCFFPLKSRNFNLVIHRLFLLMKNFPFRINHRSIFDKKPDSHFIKLFEVTEWKLAVTTIILLNY